MDKNREDTDLPDFLFFLKVLFFTLDLEFTLSGTVIPKEDTNMSKNIFILSGSPRRGGNCEILCEEFAKGAKTAGHQTEMISLSEHTVEFCIACDYCRRNHGSCFKKDDMASILKKMMQADVIVMASPIYFYSVSAQIKALIDRTLANYTQITNKGFYFMMTAADAERSSMERALECFRGFTSCLDGAKEMGVIYGTGTWKPGEIRTTEAMKEAYQMGLNV